MRLKDDAKEILIRKKAVELIVNEGLDGFNMKDLAKTCGISASTIYVYFKNKEDLFYQLTLHLRIDLIKNSVQGLHNEMPFEEGLRLQWKNRFAYFIAHPMNIQAIEKFKYSLWLQKSTPALIVAVKPYLEGFIENSIKRGELAEIPFELYWAIGFAPLWLLMEFHLAENSFANDPFSITEQIIEEAVKRISRALKP